MKLISQYQQAKFELILQSVASAVLSTVFIAGVILLTSPYTLDLAARGTGV